MTARAPLAYTPPATPAALARFRLRAPRSPSVDLLRGLVMVLMVLDHARDFFHGFRVRATDLAVTTPTLFFTRWITHFCAPVFVMLAGTAAYLYGVRHGRAALPRFLLTRGLWLVVLEVTVVRLCWIPDLGYHFTVIQVIWALGWSMIVLALVVRLPLAAIATIGAVIVAGHNLLAPIDKMDLEGFRPFWTILHGPPKSITLAPGHMAFVSYALVPWIGVMMLGYVLGALFERPVEERRRITGRLGLGMIGSFVVLRTINAYGDPVPWSSQPRGPVYTFLSFLNVEKYPPSLLFLLITLGAALCLLSVIDGREPWPVFRPLLVFGKVPLFFYIGHLVLLRYTSAPMAFARFGALAFRPPPGHAGSPECDLWVAYAGWIVALIVLYPACRWFAALKGRRTDWWLSYL